MFRGSFGTQICGGFWQNFLELAPRNAANTSVVTWGGRCLALFEAGQPYSINAATLETLGVDTLGGLLREGLPFSTGSQVLDWGLEDVLDSCGVSSPMPGGVKLGGDALSAHPCKCTSTGRLVTFSYSIQLRMNGFAPGLKTVITFYELDKDLRLVSSLDYVLDGYAFIHDFQVGHWPVPSQLHPLLPVLSSPIASRVTQTWTRVCCTVQSPLTSRCRRPQRQSTAECSA